ncbi:MAG: hypothetical protein INE97_11060 [Phenylobacterium sp.]|nr:hypothetical protein [Phenylobacterium sp.]
MTALAIEARELDSLEIDGVAGGPAPFAAALAIRAGVGGLVAGTGAFASASTDGRITKQEVANIGIAVVVGAVGGVTGGLLGKFL